MGNEIATRPSAIKAMANRISVEPEKLMEALKSTVFKNATNEELLALVVVANEYWLNPFLKEIYAFPAKGGGIVPVVSIDGWIKIINRQDQLDGIEFSFDEPEGKLKSCTCKMHLKNRKFPIVVTEFLDECSRNTEPWKQMPRRMLRHKTVIQSGRLAFGFSGISDEEEAIDIVATVERSEPAPEPKKIAQPTQDSDPSKPSFAQLAEFVTANGFTFADLCGWGDATGNIEGALKLIDFQDIPEQIAARLLKAKSGLAKGLAEFVAARGKK